MKDALFHLAFPTGIFSSSHTISMRSVTPLSILLSDSCMLSPEAVRVPAV